MWLTGLKALTFYLECKHCIASSSTHFYIPNTFDLALHSPNSYSAVFRMGKLPSWLASHVHILNTWCSSAFSKISFYKGQTTLLTGQSCPLVFDEYDPPGWSADDILLSLWVERSRLICWGNLRHLFVCEETSGFLGILWTSSTEIGKPTSCIHINDVKHETFSVHSPHDIQIQSHSVITYS